MICYLSKVSSKKTSCNIILQEHEKDRRYIFDAGANLSATKEEIMKIAQEIKPDIIVFGEIPSLGIVGNRFIELVNFIKTHTDSIICLDTLVNNEEDYNWLVGDWNKIDIVHCNYGEGMHITKCASLPEICSWFLRKGVNLAIVSNGEMGCYFGHNNAVEYVPSFKVCERDATGAGDAMMAGIITKLLDYGTNLKNIKIDIIRKMGRFSLTQVNKPIDLENKKEELKRLKDIAAVIKNEMEL